MISRIVTAASGLWLMLAPAVIGYGGAAENNDRLIGPIIAALALVAIWEVVRPVRWAVIPFGAWMLFAPLVLDYPGATAWFSAIGSGVVALASTLPQAGDASRFGGGWSSLWRKDAGPAAG